MRRLVLCLTTIVLFAACENSANPLDAIFGGGGALTQAQATGNWSLTVQRTTTFPACTNPLANGSVIAAHLDVGSSGVLAGTSSWLNPISKVVFPLTGSVNLTNGATDLHFAGASSSAQMELLGTTTASGTLSGTLRDPEPGFTQLFGTGGCEYTVSGIKTS
ncbi:MAG: hypothetical protein M3037_03455 [Gemmatimonadota bacterium]|nr:hypothetical protein [Gemmatimonadota bacterium]